METAPEPAAVESRPEWIQNLGLGLLRGGVELATHGMLLAAHEAARLRWGMVSFEPTSVATWLAAFVAYDFLYYWAHRAQHRIGVLWALHAVHHQATRFDLSVGLRVAAVNPLVLFPFFLPLAVLGLPAIVVGPVGLVHALAMTWLHTERIPSLGKVETFLNTPALHRVHHSRAEADADLNCGGLLVVWDRMFGTWSAARPVHEFGVTGEAMPASILAAHVQPFRRLAASVRSAKSRREKLRALFGQPVGAPPRHRSVHVLTVLAALGVITVGLSTRSVSAAWVVVLLVPALLVADLASGAVHWFMDRHAARFGGFLATAAAEFHDHHERPGQCLTVGVYRSVFEGALVVTPLALGTTVWARTDGGATFVLLVLLVLMFAPEIHKAAHKRSYRAWMAPLSDLGLLLGCRAHARHHQGHHGASYCVVTGWCNPLLDRSDAWNRLDTFVARRYR